MNRKQKTTILNALRHVKLAVEEAEKRASAIPVIDIGASTKTHNAQAHALKTQLDEIGSLVGVLRESYDAHIGATAVLDAVNFPRSRPPSR